ncbi:MAG: 1-deoxy-D-xylulose-5-phosphate synthase [Ruminococcus flavefaciens]|nr:1-deoxy-D-xylulose-5-phosphate synthase [Ruminococcus flavefaciens]
MEKINTIHKSDTQLLSKINSPSDLKALSLEQLPSLCAEIRRFLISEVSQNPGHFASSMGAVELTVALHYVFDTPYDRLVWDVGHQAYVHKILTGRRDVFNTNRKLGGISGFPNPRESEYDTFSAGHASNSISAALGMAVATELNKDNPRRNVVAIIGDASISGGLAFEGLNNAANTNSNLLIILNDNDMAIDRNVGSLHSYLAHITTSKSYNNFRYKTFNGLKKLHVVTDRQRGPIMRFNNSLKSLLSHEQNIFEGLNIRYFGPIDGHDVLRLVRVLTDIKNMRGPRLLHLRTTKGKGYEPAENDPMTWHAPGKFDPETGLTLSKSAPANGAKLPKYQDVFGTTLLELARMDNRVVGITAAMPSGTSMNILQHAMPSRVFDVGISEGHAVTFAGGLATDGMRPYVAIYSTFLQRAYDNIINDTALQSLPVTYCIDRAGLVGEDGVTHHGVYDMAYLAPIPGMIIASPRNAGMLRNLLYTSLKTEHGPMSIRYPRGTADADVSCEPMKVLPLGQGECLTPGAGVQVISIGPIAAEAAEAVAQARSRDIDVAHYDAVFLKPIDEDMMERIASTGSTIVTVEDGTVNGGLGTIVTQWINEHGYKNKVMKIGVPDRYVYHGTVVQLYRQCGMDTESILNAIINTD